MNGFVNPEFVMSLICFASKCGKKQPSKSIRSVEEEMWNHLQRNLDEPKILSPKKRRWQPIIYKVAATILLPVCLGLATYFGVEHMNKVSQDPFMVAVDYGQKANLTLPDGTKVWLNSATHLSYDAEYNKSDRKIYLDGEAYFEVAKTKINVLSSAAMIWR